MMPLQRIRDAEIRMRNKSSNGPLRVQSKAYRKLSILQREGIRQLPGIWRVSRKEHEKTHEFKVAPRINYSSLTVTVITVKGVFLWISPLPCS